MDDNRFLPEDIIFQILSWLPAKSVGQCRCVCRQWKDVLSQPQFIKTHLSNMKLHPHYFSLVFIGDDELLYSMHVSSAHHLFDETAVFIKQLSFTNLGHCLDWYGIYGSYDGLILVEDDHPTYYLINPATQEMRRVPYTPFPLNRACSTTIAGFGYDSLSHDYKIVTISFYNHHYHYNQYGRETFVNVFSFKNGTWKRAGNFPFIRPRASSFSFVFVGGYANMLAYRTTDGKRVIAGFDLAEEKFSEVPSPTLIEQKGSSDYHLHVVGGCLCLYSSSISDPPSNPLETDFWMMKEFGVQKSWTMFRVICPLPSTPVCLISRDQLVLLNAMAVTRHKLVMYTMPEGTSSDIVSDNVRAFYDWSTVMESLVSPHKLC